jgi:hypothetical protein
MACPVGTSLSGNVSRDSFWNPKLGNFWKDLTSQKDQNETITNIKTKIKENVDTWLEGSGSNGEKKLMRGISYPTAELQSIICWLYKLSDQMEPERDILCLELHLLPSEDPRSYLTAYMTKRVLITAQELNLLPDNIKINEPSIRQLTISVKDEAGFNNSISVLFKEYDEIRRKNSRPGAEMVINATGGYKAISMFSSIYAQINHLKFIYIFEENRDDALELPPLPVGYSLESLDDEISLLKGLKAHKGLLDKIDHSKLPSWLKNLFDFNKGGSMLPLTEILLNHYNERRFTAEAIGSGMLDQLDEDRREKLETLIRGPWSQLWLGDQIPETVEHSRRHSKRLMELAGNLYRSAPNELKAIGMLKPQAVELLIASIYLHDIGHTVVAHPVSENERQALGGVFPLGNFPSCVREAHHLLSAELVRDRSSELFTTGESTLSRLVPYLVEYHRGYTTLTQHKADCPPIIRAVGILLYGEKAFTDTLLPLEARLNDDKKVFEAYGLSIEEIITVTALLRVLDGCDVQADRTINPEYMEARLKRTKTEGEAIWWELQPLLPSKWKNFEGLAGRIHEISGSLDPQKAVGKDLATELNGLCKRVYAAVMDVLLSIKAREGGYLLTPNNHMDLMTLSLINRYAFKWEQFLHFYKHCCVGFVLPVREADKIKIKVFSNPDFKEMSDNLDGVVASINKEIAGTGEILKTLNIEVERV